MYSDYIKKETLFSNLGGFILYIVINQITIGLIVRQRFLQKQLVGFWLLLVLQGTGPCRW